MEELSYKPGTNQTEQLKEHYHHPLSWTKANRNVHVAKMDRNQICDLANGDAYMSQCINKCLKSHLDFNQILEMMSANGANGIVNSSSFVRCFSSTSLRTASFLHQKGNK